MFSDSYTRLAVFFMTVLSLLSCSSLGRYAGMAGETLQATLSLPDDMEAAAVETRETAPRIDSSEVSDGPLIMNAIRDDETGEMVATDVISASKVVAGFRNVAERAGMISIAFDVTVPSELISSSCQLRFSPVVEMPEDSITLEPVVITGRNYRKRQLKGYERYRNFLSSIITDSMVFIRQDQLEKFIMRYFPETYAMKTDSSVVPEPLAVNLFGVNQMGALTHYTRQAMKRRNARKAADRDVMFCRYVKSPIPERARLDTVMEAGEGCLTYRYIHDMPAVPGLKKLQVCLSGEVFRDGEKTAEMPSPQKLTFYVSSLSSLADNTPRYLFKVVDRVVTDNTDAFLDFGKGSVRLDTLLESNAAELARIRKCFEGVHSRKDLVMDSVTVTASCSPEGSWLYNERLAAARADAVKSYIIDRVSGLESSSVRSRHVPENWEYFRKIVENDSVLEQSSKIRILELSQDADKDRAEEIMSGMPEYRYLREKIYPRLRTVSFSFYMHRPGVMKDTIHTKVLDTLYMRGLEALKSLDYKTAATLLGSYGDYNAALALASSGYDDSALDILDALHSQDSRTYYLQAVLLSRSGEYRRARECFLRSVEKDPSMVHRANLDPELSGIIRENDEEYGFLQ